MYSPRSMSRVTPSRARVSPSAPSLSPAKTLTISSSRISGRSGSAAPAPASRGLLRFHQLTDPPPVLDADRCSNVGTIRPPAGKQGARGARITRDNIPVFPRDDQARKGPLMTPRRFLPALLLLFVGSGCAALIYEVVWFQLLELVIGSSAVSMGVLLGTFMGGMCLGSLLLPRVIGPGAHPLRVYAWLELGIGVCGLLLLFGMPLVGGAYTAWAGTGIVGILLRALAAAICLLPPTILMGATLPAIARWIERTPDGVAWLGFFYGGNTAGAVLGSLLAGFYLLSVYDISISTYVAVALNLIVAILARLLASLAPEIPLTPIASSFTRPRRSTLVYVVIGLSGFTALASEVLWTRLLSLMLGATTYTFSLILAVFLAGIGLGSSAGSALA